LRLPIPLLRPDTVLNPAGGFGGTKTGREAPFLVGVGGFLTGCTGGLVVVGGFLIGCTGGLVVVGGFVWAVTSVKYCKVLVKTKALARIHFIDLDSNFIKLL
jgi:hypothetical protein